MAEKKRIRMKIQNLVWLDKPVNCSQHVNTDFFKPGTPQESDRTESNSVVDEDLLHLDLTVKTLISSLSDLDNIINISDQVLSRPQLEILNRGLKFCPTQSRYLTSLRLKSHFKNDTNVVTERSSTRTT